MAETPIIFQFQSGLQENDGIVSPVFGDGENEIMEGNDARLSAQQVLIVKKNAGSGEFSSVKAAVDSITDATAAKPYQVFVRAGVFIEDTITMKPYVNVRGVRNSTVIEVDDPSKDLIVGTNNSEISECTLRGSTNSGKALVKVSSTAAGDVFTVRDCLFGSADIFVLMDSATLSQVTVTACMSLTTSDASVGFKVGGTGYNILNLVGFSGAITTTHSLGKLVQAFGANTTVVVHCCGVINSGGTFTTALEVYDGAALNVNSSAVLGAVTGLSVPNTGAGPLLRVANLTLSSSTSDVSMLHPSATGFLSGAWDHSKENINTSSTISVFHSDPTPGTGIAVLGDILQGEDQSKSINITKLLREGSTVGLQTGGALTKGTGAFEVDVAAGSGFLDDSSGVVQEIAWDAETLTLSANQDVYITVNENGIVGTTSSITNYARVIILGRTRSHATDICFIEDSYLSLEHWGNKIEEVLREALGPLFVSGSTVSENGTTPRSLDVTAGEFYFGSRGFAPSGGTGITFTAQYRNGSGGWIGVPSQTLVDNAKYDDGDGILGDLTAGYYVKHALYLIGDGDLEEYHLVYGQEEFVSQGEAVTGNVPTPPPFFKDGVTIIASIIMQQGTSTIVSTIDERPRIGFASTAASASSDHGSLLGLGDDDHTQYLLEDGSRAMSGNLDMGGNNVTNVGIVDGIEVSSHASRHLPNGDDSLATAIAVGLDGDTTNTIGIQNSFARSDHAHAISTGTASSQIPDQANAEGTSASLARADHVHNISAAAPTANLSGDTANQEGVANSFSRSDHSHNLDTGAPSTQGPDNANAEGSSSNLARADHIHNIPAGTPSAITPDGGNVEGTSTSFARADHVHDLPAAAPLAPLSATTTDTEGSAESVARSDHTHDISTGTPSAQIPDQPNAEGTSSNLARADHTHNIPTEVVQTVGTVNAEGTANSFARSDHVHSHGDQAGGALHAVATQSVNGFLSSTDKYVIDQIMKVKGLKQEETGFPNFTDAEFSFDDVTKTFTIQPKAPATEFSYWINGIEYVKNSSVQVAINESVNSGEGIHLFYFQGASLVSDHEPVDVSLFKDVAFVAFIYWDSTNVRHIRIQEERHGISMSGATHEYLHDIEGTRFYSGLALSGFTDGDGSNDADVQFACADGQIRDEDIKHFITNDSPQTLAPIIEIPVFYRLGVNGNYRRKDSNAYPLIYSGSAGYTGANGRIPWNRDTGAGWVLQEASEEYIVPVYVFATGDLEEPVVGVQGASQYSDATLARDGASLELLDIWQQSKGLGKESTPIGILFFQTSSSYENTAKARRVDTPAGDNYIDTRGLQISQSTTSTGTAANDHGGLSGLNDDDHQQYLNRSGVRAMTGDLDMGNNNIVTGSGTVDGVDVSDHKSRHLPTGSDPLDTAAPVTNLTGDTTNQTGTANSLSRSDHVHAVDTGTPPTLPPDQANTEGTAASLARSDHVHTVPADVPSQQLADQVNAEGVAASFARSDHIHNVPTAVPVTLSPDGGNIQGTSTSLAKADHSHNVPAATPETLTPDLGNSEGTSTSFSRSDHVHDVVAAVVAQQTADQTNAEGTASSFARSDHIHNIPTATPSELTPDAGNSQGTSTSFAKADHIHNVPAATAVTIGVANSEGTATSFARSNHVHDHGQQTQGDLHADVTRTVDGFMTAADKVKMDQQAVGVIQASNSTQFTVLNATWQTITLDTARSNYANGLLTKASGTDFRTDFAGAVEISFKFFAVSQDNDRGQEVAVYKDGNIIPHSLCRASGKKDAYRQNTISFSFIDTCANGNVYTLRARSPEGNTLTVDPDWAFMSLRVYRINL